MHSIMNPEISVVICSYNPNRKSLNRVLNALKKQTLSQEKWELILVDNASTAPLVLEINLDWHLNARHKLESNLGQTYARCTGMKASCADIVMFVDDDNILDPDYLEKALEISTQHPHIGAWGGQLLPEFEIEPEEWVKPYLWMLAIREIEVDRWTNIPYHYDAAPYGAGSCIRRAVVEKYFTLIDSDPKRHKLGRKGHDLMMCCEDVDIACTACDIGLGTGVFTRLKLHHIIPEKRLKKDYLLRIAEGHGYSSVIVESLRGKYPQTPSILGKLRQGIRRAFQMSPMERDFSIASERGFNRAFQEVKELMPQIL
jgi:glycosyltransferase involved in cell wall biosynthesis